MFYPCPMEEISSKVRHLLACILGVLWCCRLRTWRRKEVVQIGFLLSRIFDSVCFIVFLLVELMNELWVGPKNGKMYWLFLIIASSKSYSSSTVQDLSVKCLPNFANLPTDSHLNIHEKTSVLSTPGSVPRRWESLDACGQKNSRITC